MRASAIEFRFRIVFIVAAITLGFWSPWIEAGGLGRRISLLEWLALEISRLGLLRFTAATYAAIVLAALIAAAAAVLRVWGTAYLGPGIVNHLEMKAGAVMVDGPYRYVRNPLYLGTWGMVAAMAFVMPATGAVVTMALLTVFLLRLILAEEAFLAGKLGEPYRAYLRTVPRLVPRLRSNLPSAGYKPGWGSSVLAELNPIGIFITMAFLPWRFDNVLMVKAILISFGASLVVRALMPMTKSVQNAE